jgi:hypothetical protein
VLLALPTNGSNPRVSRLPAGTRSVTDDTRGVATCYVLFALRKGDLPSRTDTTCVAPGQSMFNIVSPVTVEQTAKRLEAASSPIDDVDEVTTSPPSP